VGDNFKDIPLHQKILHNPYSFYDKYQQNKLEGGLQWPKAKQIFPKIPGNAAIAVIP
jgi:hypothetical protein